MPDQPVPPLPAYAPKPGSFWTHSKTGNSYRVIGCAWDATSAEEGRWWQVIYQRLNECGEPMYTHLYARILSEWREEVLYDAAVGPRPRFVEDKFP